MLENITADRDVEFPIHGRSPGVKVGFNHSHVGRQVPSDRAWFGHAHDVVTERSKATAQETFAATNIDDSTRSSLSRDALQDL